MLGALDLFAGTIDPKVSDSKYLDYGKQHECVLPIAGILNDNLNSSFRGSCVVIDEYYALTAAHIVYDSITQHIIFQNKAYPCDIIAIPKHFDNKKNGLYDIALIKLSRPIKLDFYPEIYDKDDEVGKVCSIAGYGFTGNFNTGYKINTYDNKKRAGSNIIDKIEDHLLVFTANKGVRTELEFLIAPGDSGGGLFIDNKIAGINSMVYAIDGNANSSKNDSSCSTRVSVFKDWIIDTRKVIESIK